MPNDRPKIRDYEDTSRYFEASRAWDKENGAVCRRCGGMAKLFPPGYPCLCSTCEELDSSKGEVSSGNYIRCPKCRKQWKPSDDDYDLFNEDVHEVTCCECDHVFEIVTSISYSFESPALLEEDKDEEPEEETHDEAD